MQCVGGHLGVWQCGGVHSSLVDVWGIFWGSGDVVSGGGGGGFDFDGDLNWL